MRVYIYILYILYISVYRYTYLELYIYICVCVWVELFTHPNVNDDHRHHCESFGNSWLLADVDLRKDLQNRLRGRGGVAKDVCAFTPRNSSCNLKNGPEDDFTT